MDFEDLLITFLNYLYDHGLKYILMIHGASIVAYAHFQRSNISWEENEAFFIRVCKPLISKR